MLLSSVSLQKLSRLNCLRIHSNKAMWWHRCEGYRSLRIVGIHETDADCGGVIHSKWQRKGTHATPLLLVPRASAAETFPLRLLELGEDSSPQSQKKSLAPEALAFSGESSRVCTVDTAASRTTAVTDVAGFRVWLIAAGREQGARRCERTLPLFRFHLRSPFCGLHPWMLAEPSLAKVVVVAV